MSTYAFPANNQTARGASIGVLNGNIMIPDWRRPQMATYNPVTSGITVAALPTELDAGVSPIVQLSDFLSGTQFLGSEGFVYDGSNLTGSTFDLTDDGTNSSVDGLFTQWTATSGQQETGYCATAVDQTNNILWALGYGEGLLAYSASGTTGYSLPFVSPFWPGEGFSGLVLAGSDPLFSNVNGQIYTVSSGSITRVAPSLNTPISSLAAYNGTYYALSPSSAEVIPFTMDTPLTLLAGTPIPLPMVSPYTMSAGAFGASGLVGVTGTNPVSIGVAGSGLAFLPLLAELFATQPGSGTVSVLTNNNVQELWGTSQVVSVAGDPTFVAVLPNAEQMLVSSPSSGILSIIPETDGVWGSGTTQTFSLPGASAVLNSGNSSALVCQPSQNQIMPFYNTNAVWSSGTPIAAPGASALVLAAGAVTGYAAGASGASGIVGLEFINGEWQASGITLSTQLNATGIALDDMGGIYAAGTSGASGMIQVFFSNILVGAVSWTGGAGTIVWYEGQIAVTDPINNLIYTIGLINGTYQIINTIDGPPGGISMLPISSVVGGKNDYSWFIGGSNALWEFNWGAPYVIERSQNAVIALYDVATGVTASGTIGREQRPFAATFDSSGNFYCATDKNMLFSFTPGASLIASTTITTYTGQTQEAPLGLSALLWDNGTLYGVSCLNDALAIGI